MSDINNEGGNQYDHSMNMAYSDTETFLKVLYRNVKDIDKRKQMINLYFGEDHDNNIGDC